MALDMNSVGIPGDIGSTPGFRKDLGFLERFGVWGGSGDLGPQKAFAQIAKVIKVMLSLMMEKGARKGDPQRRRLVNIW